MEEARPKEKRGGKGLSKTAGEVSSREKHPRLRRLGRPAAVKSQHRLRRDGSH